MKYGDYKKGYLRCNQGMVWLKIREGDNRALLVDKLGVDSGWNVGESRPFYVAEDITPLDANFTERMTRLGDSHVVPGMLIKALDGLHKGMCGMVFKHQDDSTKGIQFAHQFTRSNCAVEVIGHIDDLAKKEGGA